MCGHCITLNKVHTEGMSLLWVHYTVRCSFFFLWRYKRATCEYGIYIIGDF